MLHNRYRFQKIHRNLRPSRLLTDPEKEEILHLFKSSNISMHTIYPDDWLSIHFDAKVNDIICIRDNTTDLYRIVVPKN